MAGDEEANWQLLRSPLGIKGSGRERYAAAMYLFNIGRLDAEVLEVYRICAKLDFEDPLAVMKNLGIGADWIG